MPPFGYRKRERSASPASSTPAKRKAAAKPTPKKAKPTIFDTVDAPGEKQSSVEDNKKILDQLDDDDDDESSQSEADSDEFEDVPPAKRRKTSPAKDNDEEDEEEDEEMDWEDAIQSGPSSHATPATASKGEQEIGDVSISMNEDGSYIEPLVSTGGAKKGPSKRERQIRSQAHCLHVMSLMWHNTIRNSWMNDKEVHKVLLDGLPDGVKREVRKWREATNRLKANGVEATSNDIAAKGKTKRGKKNDKSTGRDWNAAAESQETGSAQLTNTLLRLLKILTAYWRKRFTITAPGLRKQGYKDLRRLRNEIKDWEKDRKSFEEHGERIESREDFRKLAKKCDGSRDVGAQLFVALLRGLGLEARMVANLQPVGFGWSKAEEANPAKAKKKSEAAETVESESEDEVKVSAVKKKSASSAKKKPKEENPQRRSSRGNKGDPINLDDSDSPLSEPPSEAEDDGEDDDDDLSVVDVTPTTPKKKPNKKYDRDLAFPNYWTEVCDPVSNKFYPIDPIVLSTIASTDELLQTFEPRGKKAENAKQVICYTLAYAADGTAKDVTVRYLKRHQLPGKTKGVRMPIEKVPVYNRKGKVKRYEDYDWFRTLISLYDRPETQRTTADDLEEQTDLKPFKPGKENKQVEKESLQGYKQSADFVLEQHLRREEAIKPGAQPVKTFTAGKGDKAVEHPVFRRSDILTCKTVESWHKEGRAINIGEQPIKYVPMRAVTLVRKREMEDAQRETGEKLKQGLYSRDQTDWIIPPPIENGVIPKNAFGNMDVYVPTMVPQGAVHLPLKGSAKLCRKLQIDHAEACTGFEFGNQRAVPVLTGVVVAQEHERVVRDAWRAEQAEVKRREDSKRAAASLHWWRKMLLGLRVLERMRREYRDSGTGEEEVNPFVLKAEREGKGVVPEVEEEEVLPQQAADDDVDAGGGFLVDEGGGGFLVEDNADAPSKNLAPVAPVSLQSMHKSTAAEPKPEKSASKRNKPGVSSEESSLSEPSDDEAEEEEEPSSKQNNKAAKTTSTPSTDGKRNTRSAKKKSTAVRSPYFDRGEDSEDEVVRPRGTTARTRRE